VKERAGEVFRDLREPTLDEGERTGLAGSDHVAVGGLGQVGVFLILQDVVEMSEGFLLGDDGDVKLACKGDELLSLGTGEGAAGWRG
jgi:hypothetical protein